MLISRFNERLKTQKAAIFYMESGHIAGGVWAGLVAVNYDARIRGLSAQFGQHKDPDCRGEADVIISGGVDFGG
ncbi:MAG: hypothetical protein JWS11_2002 [Cypionkella sp.]|nr:hypothetical protein [Cypionkella sp.]